MQVQLLDNAEMALLRIPDSAGGAAPSKARRVFKRLIERIEHALKRLASLGALKAWLQHIRGEHRRDVETPCDALFNTFADAR